MQYGHFMRRLGIVLLELMLFWGCGTQANAPTTTEPQVVLVAMPPITVEIPGSTLTCIETSPDSLSGLSVPESIDTVTISVIINKPKLIKSVN